MRDSLVKNTDAFDKFASLAGTSSFCWRSGIKHDCAKVLELTFLQDNKYKNGLDEIVTLESDFLFPLLKSSDLANGRVENISRFLLVTQTRVGQDTQWIHQKAPQSWRYLQNHKSWFDKRKSVIYQGKSPFALFGIGAYSFSPWKIAVSGLYKKTLFQNIGLYNDKPVVFDDTCYFLPCQNGLQARFIHALICSRQCQELLDSMVFYDSKRPLTKDILNLLNIEKIARFMNREAEFRVLFPALENSNQLSLFTL